MLPVLAGRASWPASRRRLGALDPGLHRDGHGRRRAGPGPGVGSVRGRDPGRPRLRDRPGRRADRPRSGVQRLLPQRGDLLRLVPDLPLRGHVPGGSPRDAPADHGGLERYLEILGSSHVWLLAPTWIAINAALGMWTNQSLFQLTQKPSPEFAEPVPDGPFPADRDQHRPGPRPGRLLRRAGLLGQSLQARIRRTSIIFFGILGGLAVIAGGGCDQPQRGRPGDRPGRAGRGGHGRPVRAGRGDPGGPRPAGRRVGGLSRRPRRDHGPLFGLPGDRPDRRQPAGRRGGPDGRDRRAAGRNLVLLFIALVPLARLRRGRAPDRPAGRPTHPEGAP